MQQLKLHFFEAHLWQFSTLFYRHTIRLHDGPKTIHIWEILCYDKHLTFHIAIEIILYYIMALVLFTNIYVN